MLFFTCLSSLRGVFSLGPSCTSNLSLCAHILAGADVDRLCFKCIFEIATLAISADVSEVGYFSSITEPSAKHMDSTTDPCALNFFNVIKNKIKKKNQLFPLIFRL